MNWNILRRLFHFEGNLGGLRYRARLAVFELNTLDAVTPGKEIAKPPEGRLLTDGSTPDPLNGAEH